jgi:hypothetical protein
MRKPKTDQRFLSVTPFPYSTLPTIYLGAEECIGAATLAHFLRCLRRHTFLPALDNV